MGEDQPVTVDQVRTSQWRFVMHLKMADRHLVTRQCVDFLCLLSRDCSPVGRRSKAVPGRSYFVGVGQFDNLADAVEALNAKGEADG